MIVVILDQKVGVGKTTLSVNLAAALARVDKENMKSCFAVNLKIVNTVIGRDVREELSIYPVHVLNVSCCGYPLLRNAWCLPKRQPKAAHLWNRSKGQRGRRNASRPR